MTTRPNRYIDAKSVQRHLDAWAATSTPDAYPYAVGVMGAAMEDLAVNHQGCRRKGCPTCFAITSALSVLAAMDAADAARQAEYDADFAARLLERPYQVPCTKCGAAPHTACIFHGDGKPWGYPCADRWTADRAQQADAATTTEEDPS